MTVFPVFCSVPGVDPHVPHILLSEHEEIGMTLRETGNPYKKI